MSETLTIAITEGDPAGIGPELIVQALEVWPRPEDCRLVVVGFPAHFSRYRDQSLAPSAAGESTTWNEILNRSPEPGVYWADPGRPVLDQEVQPGVASAVGARAAVHSIELAIDGAMAGKIDAICTAPINKATLAEAGHPYPGHTEMLAARSGSPRVAMMLTAKGLRVVLATIHEPLSKVPSLLSRTKLVELFVLVNGSLVEFGIERPRIGVAGLNPHAGEGGLFGDEEKRIIAPAIEEARSKGMDTRGPFAADTLFHRAIMDEFDVVVAMYHDQGLIPIKTLDFFGGVNVTLGLPFVRTSPDHGTAYDIAGTGRAKPDSLLAALQTAYDMAVQRRKRLAATRSS